MQIQIDVIDVSKPVPGPGGKYSHIEVAYRKDGKVEGKKLMSFVHPEVYKAAQSFVAGNTYNIEIGKEAGKDGKEYWQWQKVYDGSAPASPVAEAGAPFKPAAKPVSNYETKEERVARQVMIVRQSSISNAIATLGTGKHKVDDVLDIAKKYEAFVMATDPIQDLIDMEDDIPL